MKTTPSSSPVAVATGGAAVVEALRKEGAEVVFGIPGEYTLAIYDALALQQELRHVLTRHEQGAAFAAQGYALASGKVGVCCVTAGPGVYNALGALGEAFGDSTPVLCIAGQVEREFIGQLKGVTHEAKDQLGVLQRVVGWAAEPRTVEDVAPTIQEAYRRMRQGRPRPTAVQIPVDVLNDRGPIRIGARAAAKPQTADAREVERAADLLIRSERPVIWAGGGVNSSGANDDLRAIAELLDAPLVTTVQGKGAIAEDHPLALGHWVDEPPVRELLRRSDVMLAVGTRFTKRITANWSAPVPRRLIQIDIDPDQIGKNYPTEVRLVGDAPFVLRQLREAMTAGDGTRSGGSRVVAEIRERVTSRIRAEYPAEYQLVSALRAALPRDAIMLVDIAVASLWLRPHFPVYAPRSFFTTGGFGALGFSIPAAIGAKAATPHRKVVAVCGDGGFYFTYPELSTAVQAGLDVCIILFNNNAHQVIKDAQTATFGSRYIATDLINPNYVQLAESLGVRGIKVSKLSDFAGALRECLDSPGTTLMEITIPIRRPDLPIA